MRRALDLARKGLGCASPNPTVGCVIVREGRIVGQACHDYGARDHAEVRAIQQAGKLTRGAAAYVTLEPCSHHGRTPPCANLLIQAGIRRVVVAMIDPNPRVSGKGIQLLRSAGIQVDLGLMQDEAQRLIESFACHVTSGRPLVVAKVGMSLDGRIATERKADGWITSPEGRDFGQSLRFQMDAIMVGIGTVLVDDPELSYRGAEAKARPLVRVILDSRLRTPPCARIFDVEPWAPVLIFCRPDVPDARRRNLESRGAEIVPVCRTEGGLNLNRVLKEVGKRDVLGVLVEGGSEVHWSFAASRLVDKFYFILAPVVLGGTHSVPSVGGIGYEAIASAPRFKILRTFSAGDDLVLETYPSYSRSILSPWQRLGTAPCVVQYSPPPSVPI